MTLTANEYLGQPFVWPFIVGQRRIDGAKILCTGGYPPVVVDVIELNVAFEVGFAGGVDVAAKVLEINLVGYILDMGGKPPAVVPGRIVPPQAVTALGSHAPVLADVLEFDRPMALRAQITKIGVVLPATGTHEQRRISDVIIWRDVPVIGQAKFRAAAFGTANGRQQQSGSAFVGDRKRQVREIKYRDLAESNLHVACFAPALFPVDFQ